LEGAVRNAEGLAAAAKRGCCSQFLKSESRPANSVSISRCLFSEFPAAGNVAAAAANRQIGKSEIVQTGIGLITNWLNMWFVQQTTEDHPLRHSKRELAKRGEE
jgi:hypothetical protein